MGTYQVECRCISEPQNVKAPIFIKCGQSPANNIIILVVKNVRNISHFIHQNQINGKKYGSMVLLSNAYIVGMNKINVLRQNMVNG